jgi:hypothetical protein
VIQSQQLKVRLSPIRLTIFLGECKTRVAMLIARCNNQQSKEPQANKLAPRTHDLVTNNLKRRPKDMWLIAIGISSSYSWFCSRSSAFEQSLSNLARLQSSACQRTTPHFWNTSRTNFLVFLEAASRSTLKKKMLQQLDVLQSTSSLKAILT